MKSLPPILRFKEQYEHGPGEGQWLLEHLDRPKLGVDAASAGLEFSTHPWPGLEIAEGPLAGRTWPELLKDFGERLAGESGMWLYGGGLGLEVRLRAAEHVPSSLRMVEPATTRQRPRKAPRPLLALHVIEARPDSCIYFGRRKNLEAERFKSLLIKSPDPELLQEIPAQAGTVLLAPAGFPYALGAGVLAYEVLVEPEKTEAPARVSYTRVARHLVIEPLPRQGAPVAPLGYIEGQNAFTWLYASSTAATMRLDLRSQWREGPGMGFAVLTGVYGRALVVSGECTETISKGRSLVLPAERPAVSISPEAGGASILKTWLPDVKKEIEKPLRERGITQREIERLYGFFGRERL
ncbi:MAG: hypothetical protein R6V10_03560 [bacterium]